MMRRLAEFVMAGRKQAILAVLLTGVVPFTHFLSPLIVALVLLRKGVTEATPILIWAAIPIAAWSLLAASAADVAINFLPLIVLSAVTAMAAVLRKTGSWQLALLLLSATGLFLELVLRLQPQLIDQMQTQLASLSAASGAQPPERDELIWLVVFLQLITSLLLLIWSRWLQARLYNPGGFREEFHALRIEKTVAIGLLVFAVLGRIELLPGNWMFYFLLPFIVAGTSLVHSVVASRKMSGIWLFLFYLVMPVILLFLVLVAVMDTWIDFRKRYRAPG